MDRLLAGSALVTAAQDGAWSVGSLGQTAKTSREAPGP